MTTYFRLTPLDAALFRDARPYDAADAQGARLGSWIPPQLSALGALRKLLLASKGISYDRFAAGDGGPVLGEGPESPGSLQLGPLQWARQERTAATVFYPAPADVFSWRTWDGETGFGLQLPAANGYFTNQPAGLLPLSPFRRVRDAWKPIAPGDELTVSPQTEGRVFDQCYLARYLLGEAPADLPELGHFANVETKAGLELDRDQRTNKTGRLYTAELLRLSACIPDHWAYFSLPVCDGAAELPGGRVVLPLGGERHPFEFCRETLAAPLDPAVESAVRAALLEAHGPLTFRIYLLSPAPPGPEGWKPRLPTIPGVSLDIVAAAVSRAQWISGWSVAGPLPGRPHIPAGSVFFVRVESALEREPLVDAILREFWFKPSLCDPRGPEPIDRLAAKAGLGVTLVGVASHG